MQHFQIVEDDQKQESTQDSLLQRCQDLERQLAQITTERNAIRSKNDDLKRLFKGLEDHRDELVYKLQNALNANDKLTKRNEHLEAENDNLHARVHDLERGSQNSRDAPVVLHSYSFC